MNDSLQPDLILYNGRITTLDPKYPEAKCLAIKGDRIISVDDAEEYQRGPNTKAIDLKGRRVVPGLNDSHLHCECCVNRHNVRRRDNGLE